MIVYLLYGLFFLSCIVLVLGVLLQPGKADAGALFTSSISSTAFGQRGTQTVLAKITIGAATVFFLSALMLAMPAITGSVSVLQTQDETSLESTVETSEANTATNANVSTDANAANANAGAASNATASNSAANTEANK